MENRLNKNTNMAIYLRPVKCKSCGIIFGIPMGFYFEKYQDGTIFFCPRGHGMVYKKKKINIEKGSHYQDYDY